MNRETATIYFCLAVLGCCFLWRINTVKVAPVVTGDDMEGNTQPIVVAGPAPVRQLQDIAAPVLLLPPAIIYTKNRCLGWGQ